MIINFIDNLQQKLSVTRAAEWWYFKGAPVLGTVYIASAMLDLSPTQIWQLLIFILFSLAITAAYANMLNDFSDQKDDLACGKKNGMIGRSPLFKITIFALCILPGLAIAYTLSPIPTALIMYVSMWGTFSAYSLPPLRLKTKGLWGVLADSAGAHLLPQMYAVSVVMGWSGKNLPLIWLIALAIWSFFAGIRGIFWHQLKDLENDRQTGVNTFATDNSPESLQKYAQFLIFPLEIMAFTVVLILSNNILVWFFMGIYLLSEWRRQKDPSINMIIVAPQNNYDRFAMYKYYEVLYPLAFLLQLAWQNPFNWLLVAIHFILYPKRLWYWGKNLIDSSKIDKISNFVLR